MWFNLKYADISIKTLSIYCLYWDSKPPKVVVEIALEIILQPLKVFASVRNKNSENSENPKITASTKFTIEGIYKTYLTINALQTT